MTESHPFFSPKTHGFVRVAAATPVSHVGDPVENAQAHLALIRQAADQGVDLMVFPELSLSAYAIDDLHMQAALLDEVERQVAVLAQATGGATAEHELIAVVGAPLRQGDALFNCAVVMGGGEVLAVVPKTYLPNYREYYEKRWFAPATARTDDVIRLNGETVDFAPGLVFEAVNRPGFVFAVEICEDYWAPLPPSTRAALAGARILLNLSASNIVIGKADERAMLSAGHSARTLSAYVFAASGWGESTTDLAWDGQATIHELGTKLAEGERFALENQLTIADVDVDRIGLDRLRNGTFADCARNEGEAATVVPFMARDVPPPLGEGDREAVEGVGAGGGRARPPPRAPPPRGGPPPSRRCAPRHLPQGGRIRVDPAAGPFPFRAGRGRTAGPGLLRSLQHPGSGPDAPNGGDQGRTSGDRRLGRAGFDPGPAGRLPRLRPAEPAANQYSRLHHAGFRHLGRDQVQCLGPDEGAWGHGGRDRHPPGGRTDVP
jgi:NAD+ synthase (glutamine-hydrolysing)